MDIKLILMGIGFNPYLIFFDYLREIVKEYKSFIIE